MLSKKKMFSLVIQWFVQLLMQLLHEDSDSWDWIKNLISLNKKLNIALVVVRAAVNLYRLKSFCVAKTKTIIKIKSSM